MPVIAALRQLREEDLCEFKTKLNYRVRLCLRNEQTNKMIVVFRHEV